MARYFIDRPIFAWVIAIVIMLAGGGATLELALRAVHPGSYVDDLEALLSTINRPVHYVGHGLGGSAALPLCPCQYEADAADDLGETD